MIGVDESQFQGEAQNAVPTSTSEPTPPTACPLAVNAHQRTLFGVTMALFLVTCVAAVVIIGTLQQPEVVPLSYGVVLDLGSSGSRVHIVQWTTTPDGSGCELDSIQPAPAGASSFWTKKVSPGVSSYSENPEEAAKSLRPLLEYAVTTLTDHHIVPSEVQLVCYATAGMRMLSKDVSAQVEGVIREFIVSQYSFKTSEDAIRVISGQEEALFDYVAVQQLLRVFDDEGRERKHIGALDLGGSSVELAFEVGSRQVNQGPVTRSPEPAYVTPVTFNDTIVDVYGVAYTGLGHNAAFSAILELAVDLQVDTAALVEDTYPHPCLHYGATYTHHVDDDDDSNDVRFVGTGEWSACVEMTRLLMNRSATCESERCAFNGVYQPPVEGFFVAMDNFASTAQFYGVGVQPMLRDFIPATQEYCSLDWDYVRGSGAFRKKESRLRELCFEGVFVHELLTYGFGFAEGSSSILFTDQLFGVDVDWSLGAIRLRMQQLDSS